MVDWMDWAVINCNGYILLRSFRMVFRSRISLLRMDWKLLFLSGPSLSFLVSE
jgi:hypothetical protein